MQLRKTAYKVVILLIHLALRAIEFKALFIAKKK